ncbi:MAG: hypothetical protein Ct9H300mP25_14780 [Acidobacteriota bacterium]|nr:MAG: hypothetical protein Ct9H300mP25_14780 [Acidobacteriota bacterium]
MSDDVAGDGCVTRQEMAAIEAVYNGPTVDGESIFFGFNYGGESDRGGWDSWVVSSERQRAAAIPMPNTGLVLSFISILFLKIRRGITPPMIFQHGGRMSHAFHQ